ncbi:MAG: AMP-binding protein [Alphaproteobacteria bacterium]|jgi:acetyl-CoA synthetase|nr:AMP-binding protein [Alphaproteobacteria bacterium]MBT4019517.1 AMP-binding protein [Alphaproteobacteria bacterium]MBT4967339.1 AMP-binding protein [Alphaproteobacteria bacterium]MBT5159715.1 AMP-binding protein [Alphaproteobacteria bacterium]MBT5920087.1 AMP-binding protein [Alphaproteobacteria bacterium]
MADNFPPFDYEAARAEFSFDVADDFNFAFDVVGKRGRENDKTALIAIDRSGENVVHHSYADLDRASNRFANALIELGIQKGDSALVVIPRIAEWYHVLLGCTKIGAVSMPGTNLLTGKDIEYRINKAGAKIAVVTETHATAVDKIKDNCPTLEHLIVIGSERPGWSSFEVMCAAASDEVDRAALPQTKSDELMLIYFTSGTTAMPKMVGRDHAYSLAHSITGDYWANLKADDIHWALTDTGWAKAAWGLLCPPLLAGSAVLLYDGEGFDVDAHLKIIQEQKVTTFCAPPTIYRVLAQTDVSGYDLSSLRHCIGAGEPLNPEAMRSWKEATGCDIHDGYGQTETINIVANIPGMEIRPGSMGKPVPGIDLDVIDDDGNVVADDEVGHIAVKITDPWPPGLFHGYYKDDAATAKSFRNGWYYTGDTATRDADGYIWFVGRSDDVITSSGYRISPFEVESALMEHEAVVESAVVAKKDDMRGEIVLAYIILGQGYEASDDLAKEIQNFIKKLTAPYKYPRQIVFREALPKTISGKIRRVELREEAENL